MKIVISRIYRGVLAGFRGFSGVYHGRRIHYHCKDAAPGGYVLEYAALITNNKARRMRNPYPMILCTALLSASSLAAVPHTFKAGDIATAQTFNENFTALDTRISTLETAQDNTNPDTGNGNTATPDGWYNAQVNGVGMLVYSHMLGYYLVKTPTGLTVNVNVEGYPRDTTLYYENENCVGTPYTLLSQLPVTGKSTGDIYTNPKIDTSLTMTYDGESIFYSLNDTAIKLNYKSYGPSTRCSNRSGSRAVSRLLPNDVNVTGLESFPLIITGVGSDIEITEEVGTIPGTPTTPTQTNYIVYAAGQRIGTTTKHPNYSVADDTVYVKLDAFEGRRITLYKDGSYTGFSTGKSNDMFYTTSDCTGNAYVEVIKNKFTEWWDAGLVTSSLIKNGDSYYTLSAQVYTFTNGATGKQYYSDGRCIEITSTTTIDKTKIRGYRMATLTDNPEVPVINPPITIEGYTEPTPYETLPEAY